MIDPPIKIELTIQPDRVEILEGLEEWLRLGLLSQQQVKQICRVYLVCELRLGAATAPVVSSPIPVVTGSYEPQLIPESETNDRAPVPLSPIAQRLQSLMAEISVLWLLFLGVFMVVVSSGVLAATQWRNVPPTGQYGILLAYTLAFWGAGAWAKRQANLRLTARMLLITTLLLIPVNFWMMDGFKLWNNALGMGVAAIATLILTGLYVLLLRSERVTSPASGSHWILVNGLALSWLHWGWGWTGVPLIATYLGTTGTAAVLFYQNQESGDPTEEPATRQLPLGIVAIAFGTLVLLVRAILVARIPISQLGLAVGICGWVLCWLSRREERREPWNRAGVALLLTGWLVAVTGTFWQAIAVSGLGMGLLVERLQQQRQVRDLVTLFGVGLQAYVLLWWVIPDDLRQSLLNFCVQIVGQEGFPEALTGIALFPYILFTLLVGMQVRRWERSVLVDWTEKLALGLGVILTFLSLGNPTVRSLNLLLSTLTLGVVTSQRTHAETGLIYLTHAAGLSTLASGIHLFLPELAVQNWMQILLLGMGLEWLLAIVPPWSLWKRSAWHVGLFLASLSYWLLLNLFLQEADTQTLIWLAVPVGLTLLATRPQFPERQQAVLLSVLALILLQPLILDDSTARLVGLGVATIVMVANTYYLPQVAAAALTLGFGLLFSFFLLWENLEGLAVAVWVNLLASVPLLFWFVRQALHRVNQIQSRIYRVALDGWAIAISMVLLCFLISYNLFTYLSVESTIWEYALVATIVTIAIAYRTWIEPRNWGFYSVALGLELWVITTSGLFDWSLERLAIVNLGLGFLIQLAGDWWIRRSGHSYRSSWHLIPLLYALLGVWFQHGQFTATSGLYTLGAALVGIGVGRRESNFKGLIYLSVIGITVAAYELLIYQLLQATGGEAGDGMVLLATLAAAIAVGVRLGTRWLIPYLRLNFLELQRIAHFHWIGGTILLTLAQIWGMSSTGAYGWIAIMTLLAGYALVQGREQEDWIYAGILEILTAIANLLYLLLPDQIWWSWGAAMTVPLAYGMYSLPWTAWGWSAKPWRRTAVILPGSAVLLTAGKVVIPGLLIVAAFYAWLARIADRIRLSYLGIFLVDWAIFLFLDERNFQEPLWYAGLLGGSLLYVAQVDPYLQIPSERENRHILRCLATGLIGLTALYQSDLQAQGLEAVILSLMTIGIGIGLILVGLALRVRAYLYVGTAVFILKVLRQLWLFVTDYSLLLWAIGIVLGLTFIWIASTLETRRSQVSALVNYWVTELRDWQ